MGAFEATAVVGERTHTRWLLIFWIFIISAIAYLDRVNISIAGRMLAEQYRLSDRQLGPIFSAFVLGYALFQTPAGRLADRWGARRMLAAGVVWWGLFTALTALSPFAGAMLAYLIVVRFLLGAGEAVVYPSSNRVVANWIPVSERGIANGWIFAGVGAGAGMTPRLITWVMIHHGWRSSFFVCAVIGLVAGLIWYVIARDRPEEHPWVSEAELETIRRGIDENVAMSGVIPWSRIVTSKEVIAVTISYFAYGYTAYIFFSWFFIYLNKVRGLNLTRSSYYTMLPFIAMAVCSPLGGVICDLITRWRGKRAGRCGIAVVGMAVAAGFLVFGSRAHDAGIASVVLAGGAGALYLSQSSFWSVTADIGGASAASVSGLMNMGGQIGGAVTASLTPIIAQHFGWTMSFVVAAALCVIGALAWLFVEPDCALVGVD